MSLFPLTQQEKDRIKAESLTGVTLSLGELRGFLEVFWHHPTSGSLSTYRCQGLGGGCRYEADYAHVVVRPHSGDCPLAGRPETCPSCAGTALDCPGAARKYRNPCQQCDETGIVKKSCEVIEEEDTAEKSPDLFKTCRIALLDQDGVEVADHKAGFWSEKTPQTLRARWAAGEIPDGIEIHGLRLRVRGEVLRDRKIDRIKVHHSFSIQVEWRWVA